MNSKEIIDLSTGLLTPLIAVITAYIAYQQYKTNKLQLRHELYDRRMAIYKLTMVFVNKVWRGDTLTEEMLSQLDSDNAETYFLFDRGMHNYLDSLFIKATELCDLDKQSEESISKSGQSPQELRKWFEEERIKIRERFAEYLSVEALK